MSLLVYLSLRMAANQNQRFSPERARKPIPRRFSSDPAQFWKTRLPTLETSEGLHQRISLALPAVSARIRPLKPRKLPILDWHVIV
jgi:hypothetical protein